MNDTITMQEVADHLARFVDECGVTRYRGRIISIRMWTGGGELAIESDYVWGESTAYVGSYQWGIPTLTSGSTRSHFGPTSRESFIALLNAYIAECVHWKGKYNSLDYTLQYALEASMRPKLTVGPLSFLAPAGSEAEALFGACLKGEVPVSVVLDWYEDNRILWGKTG